MDKKSKDIAINITEAMHLGERCKYCGKRYETLHSLKDTVYAGHHEHGSLACKKCWNENNKEKEIGELIGELPHCFKIHFKTDRDGYYNLTKTEIADLIRQLKIMIA